MKKYSSIHNIDSSSGLDLIRMGLFFLLNIANNMLPALSQDKRIAYSNFIPRNIELCYQKLEEKSSPSRMLSNLFWCELPWGNIKKELGGQINILDIGCGKGGQPFRLNKFSGGRIKSYHGVDIHSSKEWNDIPKKNVRFSKYDGQDLSFALGQDVNMIISQSSLEHVEEDLSLFGQIAGHIKAKMIPTLQVHVFPSPVCLILYLTHGIRQYTRRTISKITRLFDDESRFILFGLGGRNCFNLHWKTITKPRLFMGSSKGDLRDEDSEYSVKLYDAICSDGERKRNRLPIFYAMMIYSNCE